MDLGESAGCSIGGGSVAVLRAILTLALQVGCIVFLLLLVLFLIGGFVGAIALGAALTFHMIGLR